MAERIVQEESLASVADAIRAKDGTSEALSFPAGFVDAIAAIQAGGGGGGSIEGLTIKSGSFTPSSDITTSYDIIVDPENPTGKNNKRVLFILFRDCHIMNDDTRGISSVGLMPTSKGGTSGTYFGGYVGGAGSNNNNLTNHNISTNDTLYGNTITITCSSNAPLSANKYVWIELSYA